MITLKLSEEQAKVIADALELYARVGIGQINYVAEVYKKNDPFANNLNIHRVQAEYKRELTGLNENCSYGIVHPDVHNDFKIAFDAECVIRHTLATNDPKTRPYHNDLYKPYQTAKNVELAECIAE